MTKTTEKIKKFVSDNFKILVTILAFLVTFYGQHVTNTNRLNELEEHCDNLELNIADQYDLNKQIKLTKTVF